MGMVTVVVDTREQEPYGFDSESIASIRKALPAGDYSIEGFETRVAVERKSMADFVSTVIRGRKRFHKELEKLRDYDAACVVVEANYRDILGACYQSDAHPNALIGTISSIIIDFGVPVYFCSDRQAACRFVEGFLMRFHRRFAQCQKKQTPRQNSGEE